MCLKPSRLNLLRPSTVRKQIVYLLFGNQNPSVEKRGTLLSFVFLP